MIEASCHCGAVQFAVETAPGEVNDCNCSICRRYGALWAYYHPQQVRFVTENGPTDIYMWGDRKLEFHRCRTCGCITHWSAVNRALGRIGVNARLMPPEVLAAIPVFHGDGAAMWGCSRHICRAHSLLRPECEFSLGSRPAHRVPPIASPLIPIALT
jgi:hypothetical protein